MNPHDAERHALSRREFLAASGALVVSFALAPPSLARRRQPAARARSCRAASTDTPLLDSWIRIDADGSITVFTGKAELGQGIKTALIQLAAEELVVAPQRIKLVTADTRRTPNEGYTAGSHSMQDSGTAILNAAAQVREILLARASRRVSASPPTDSRRRTAPSSPTTDGALGYRRARRRTDAARRCAPTAIDARGRRRRKRSSASRCRASTFPRKVTGGVDLRAGPAAAGHGARARGAAAELRRAAARARYARRREDARRAQGRARRQLRRGRRRARVPGDRRRCARSPTRRSWDEQADAARRRPSSTRICSGCRRTTRRSRQASAVAESGARQRSRRRYRRPVPDARLDRSVVRGRRCSRTAR